ncbi:2-aminobenzoate-CoA ligase [Magnetospirillum sp. ME-1]|uniref:benzoate-CoA ligase family protein n=1 Tax=Magnetospirillum sp. ME-1 TaxID=1639348 RepID=UPI000A17DBBF|nr:benzoate-CoA ligase family protein [Magnetospirillum sp. ME-1]ARJ67862.1 2-aminobenzoate-CoA ligase [Magnetospirillum sp. ME-1]
MAESLGRSAHLDSFARDGLPPRELWPVMDPALPPLCDYPDDLNIGTVLLDETVTAGRGERTAVLYRDRVWSYADLLDRANRIANVLTRRMGLVPGNRVLLRGPNTPMLLAAWFAVVKAGGVCVATMPLLRGRELAYIAAKAQVSHALCDIRFAEELEAARAETPGLVHLMHFSALGEESESLDRAMAEAPSSHADVATSALDVALIAFTSGTTGPAKATMHVHRDLLAVCDCFPRHVAGVREDDRFCGSPPLAFTFGLGALALFPLRVGASVVLVESFTPETMLKTIQDYRVTGLYTAPTAYRAMAALALDWDLTSLRMCVSAGEHLPLATSNLWHRMTGIRIIDGIGSTELLHIFISAAGDDIRPGSTGRAIFGYEARIVDAAGQPVPPGTPGRLAVRGPTGCRYLNDPERQRKYVDDGWNLTGDVYTMDEDGYFWYQARSDDMIVSAGYNISGPEVEGVLMEHPKVLECAVVGLADEERGQVVSAFVVLKDPSDGGEALIQDLQSFVKNRIAPYKYPRRVKFVHSLPRTPTGKLQRFALRDL